VTAPGNDMVVMIMAGGGGTRFWPVSTKQRPKQFLTLVGDESLLRASYERAASLVPAERILVLTNESFIAEVQAQLPELPAANIVGEPMRRDTAAAACLGALISRERFGDAVVAVLAADHWISPIEEFQRSLLAGARLASAHDTICTLGIRPAYPATGYGYIHAGAPQTDSVGVSSRPVIAFKEKPDAATAHEYLLSGTYWWNSGMFVWRVSTILAAIERFLPDHLASLERVVKGAGDVAGAGPLTAAARPQLAGAFKSLPSVSIDYGVMEKADNVTMVEATFVWSDVGGWPALAELLDEQSGNMVRGRVIAVDAGENVVFCEDPEDLVGLVGVDGLIVVRAGHRTLVAGKSHAEDVKKLVNELEKRGQPWDV
jgi:mannose-1-phosphate guanylyltransferase